MWYVLIKGLSFGLLLAISVSALLFMTIKQSIRNGKPGGFAFITGVFLSDIILASAVVFFTELFMQVIQGKDIVTIVGSLFLLVVGIYFLFFKKTAVDQEGNLAISFSKRDSVKIFITGFLMNILNPGVWFFWLMAASAVAEHSLQQRLAIFGIALVFNFGTDILKVLLSARIRQRLTPHNIQLLSRLNGLILILFSVGLLVYYLFFKH